MKNVDYITAGAGSGKTYTLTQRLAKLIREQGYSADEVILTTFSKLAAAEFKQKAREELLSAGMVSEAVKLEAAEIGTVHAIANNFITKYWYLLGRGAVSNVITDSDQEFYIRRSLASVVTRDDHKVFREMVAQFNYQKSHSSQSDDNFWRSHLVKVIELTLQYGIKDFCDSVTASHRLIDSIFICERSESIVEEIKLFLKEYITGLKKETAKSRKATEIIANLSQDEEANYRNYMEVYKFVKELNELKKPPIGSAVIVESLSRLLRDKGYGELQKRYVSTIFDLAGRWVSDYINFKRLNNIIDYNDMERLFLELLEKEEVQQEIRSSYKLLFVDELQDSSPMQIKIFDRLSELLQQSIFVGDPKQAIYSFRGSDMSLVGALAQMFSREENPNNLRECDSLPHSWRSRKPIVEFTNTIFRELFRNTLSPSQITLSVPPQRESEEQKFEGSTLRPITHWHFAESNNSKNHKALAQRIAEMVLSDTMVVDKQTKERRRIIPRDIAILCRTNEHIESIATELKNAGVRVNCTDADMERVEIALIKAILGYLLNPTNVMAKATILHLTDPKMDVTQLLSSRFDYLSKDESQSGWRDGWATDNACIQRIDALRSDLLQLSLPELVEGVILRLDLISFMKHWSDCESRLGNINRIISLAEAYDERCVYMGSGSSLIGFLNYLDESDAKGEITNYPDAVNILTYHRSKGLEWSVVVMCDLHSGLLERYKYMFASNIVSLTPPSKENLYPERFIQLLPNINYISNEKPIPEIIDTLEQNELCGELCDYQREELKRLLYVGVTRARDYLITTSAGRNTDLKWLKNTGIEALSMEDDRLVIGEYEIPKYNYIINEEFAPLAYMSENYIVRKAATKRAVEAPRYIVPSQLEGETEGVKVEVVERISNRRIVLKSSTIEMSVVGTCLHNFFCIYQHGSENERVAKRVIESAGCAEVLPDTGAVVESMDNLYQFMTARYGEAKRIYRELPISAERDGQILRGDIDLLWEREDGCVVVDYKSYPGSVEEITNREGAHYAGKYMPQLQIYRELIEATSRKVVDCLIYYAVQGVVVRITRV